MQIPFAIGLSLLPFAGLFWAMICLDRASRVRLRMIPIVYRLSHQAVADFARVSLNDHILALMLFRDARKLYSPLLQQLEVWG